MSRPPATLAELRTEIEKLRDELGELGGELLHRLDRILRRLRDGGLSGPGGKGKVRRRTVHLSEDKK